MLAMQLPRRAIGHAAGPEGGDGPCLAGTLVVPWGTAARAPGRVAGKCRSPQSLRAGCCSLPGLLGSDAGEVAAVFMDKPLVHTPPFGDSVSGRPPLGPQMGRDSRAQWQSPHFPDRLPGAPGGGGRGRPRSHCSARSAKVSVVWAVWSPSVARAPQLAPPRTRKRGPLEQNMGRAPAVGPPGVALLLLCVPAEAQALEVSGFFQKVAKLIVRKPVSNPMWSSWDVPG